MDLRNLTIKKARRMLDSKEITAVELASAYLEEIKKKNPELNAYLEVYDDVLAQAEAADKRIQVGESTPLLGIPLAIKDNILIQGKKVTAASKILEGYVAPYDATAISKLKAQGAVFLGRLTYVITKGIQKDELKKDDVSQVKCFKKKRRRRID